MKKITILSLVVLATVLLTFASTRTSKDAAMSHNKYVIETEAESQNDIENDAIYNSLRNDFNIISQIETERINDEQKNELFLDIVKDFNLK